MLQTHASYLSMFMYGVCACMCYDDKWTLLRVVVCVCGYIHLYIVHLMTMDDCA